MGGGVGRRVGNLVGCAVAQNLGTSASLKSTLIERGGGGVERGGGGRGGGRGGGEVVWGGLRGRVWERGEFLLSVVVTTVAVLLTLVVTKAPLGAPILTAVTRTSARLHTRENTNSKNARVDHSWVELGCVGLRCLALGRVE